MYLNVMKKGRPSATRIPELIQEGKSINSNNKCNFCYRIFAKPKSLSAHLRIHKNEKPYECIYPKCNKCFRQSGHLKNHVRCHTGEAPFRCTAAGCSKRFSHSCGICSDHPGHKLMRDAKEQICMKENLSEDELKWFEEYKRNKGRPPKRVLPAIQYNTMDINDVPASSSSGTYDDSGSESSTSYYSSPVTLGNGLNNSGHVFRYNINQEDIEVADILCSFSQKSG